MPWKAKQMGALPDDQECGGMHELWYMISELSLGLSDEVSIDP